MRRNHTLVNGCMVLVLEYRPAAVNDPGKEGRNSYLWIWESLLWGTVGQSAQTSEWNGAFSDRVRQARVHQRLSRSARTSCGVHRARASPNSRKVNVHLERFLPPIPSPDWSYVHTRHVHDRVARASHPLMHCLSAPPCTVCNVDQAAEQLRRNIKSAPTTTFVRSMKQVSKWSRTNMSPRTARCTLR